VLVTRKGRSGCPGMEYNAHRSSNKTTMEALLILFLLHKPCQDYDAKRESSVQTSYQGPARSLTFRILLLDVEQICRLTVANNVLSGHKDIY
jgi:hypothetical protein